MISGFAIIPDGQNIPSALFTELEDALDWGLTTYGGDAFRIRFLEVAQVQNEDRDSASRPT
jgi:hypothetical protein